MLSAADRALAQRDPAIPGLGLLLDAQELLSHLPAVLQRRADGIIQRTYLRYKPGMNCLARYRLGAGDSRLDIYAKAHGDDAGVKLAKAGKRSTVTVGDLPGRITLPETGIVVCLFPNDNKLKQLHRLGDADALGGMMRDMLPHHHELHRPRIELLQYKPERRLVACLHGRDGTRAAIKFYDGRSYASALHTLQGEDNGIPDWFPLLLGYSGDYHALVGEWVTGPVLSECYGQSGFGSDRLVELGRRLAQFHAQDINRELPVRNLHAESGKLACMVRNMEVLAPAIHARCAMLAERIGGHLLELPQRYDCLHGDFYAKQVLCTERGIQLLDSDEVCIGHAAADLGLFIAHLRRDVLRGRITAARADAVEAALLEGYRWQGRAVGCHEIALFAAAGLLQLCHHPFRNAEAGWEAGMAAILDLAARQLATAESTGAAGTGRSSGKAPTVTLHDPENARFDHGMPCLRQALEAERVAAALRDCLQQGGCDAGAFRLTSMRVLRHRPGRRAVLEYRLEGAGEEITLIGKLRARGLDRRTWNLNEALHASGFGASAERGAVVPEPVGAVADMHMWLQRRVVGIPGWQALTWAEGGDAARRIAAALAALHGAELPVDRVHGSQRELAILERNIEFAMQRLPQCRTRLENVLAACRKLAAGLPESADVGIHRDFYHDQVIVRDDSVCLLDLDLYCRGDGALDVGNFLAHVEEQCLREFGDSEALVDVCAAFTDAYRQACGGTRLASIDIWRRLSLARHLGISQRIPSRNRVTVRLLDLCERQLGLRTRVLIPGHADGSGEGKGKRKHERLEIIA